MHRLLGIVCVAAAVIVACAHARAGGGTMTTDFVGDWCFDGVEKNVSQYRLLNRTGGGHCTKILSIDKYGFYFNDEKRYCEPVKMRPANDVAPSGAGYIATITARCLPEGWSTVKAGELQTFEFWRSKRNLTVTTK